MYVDFPPSLRPTRETVVRSSFRTMENSRSTFPPMNEETVVPKVLAIFTSVPREGETIRFSICVSSAAENPVLSANCCTVKSQALPECPHVLPDRDLGIPRRLFRFPRLPGHFGQDVVHRLVTREIRQGRLLPSMR